jgi:hypothetical protein
VWNKRIAVMGMDEVVLGQIAFACTKELEELYQQ